MLGVPTELDNNRTPVTLKGQKPGQTPIQNTPIFEISTLANV